MRIAWHGGLKTRKGDQSEKIDISSNNWVIYNPTTTIDNISKDIEGNIQLNSNLELTYKVKFNFESMLI